MPPTSSPTHLLCTSCLSLTPLTTPTHLLLTCQFCLPTLSPSRPPPLPTPGCILLAYSHLTLSPTQSHSYIPIPNCPDLTSAKAHWISQGRKYILPVFEIPFTGIRGKAKSKWGCFRCWEEELRAKRVIAEKAAENILGVEGREGRLVERKDEMGDMEIGDPNGKVWDIELRRPKEVGVEVGRKGNDPTPFPDLLMPFMVTDMERKTIFPKKWIMREKEGEMKLRLMGRREVVGDGGLGMKELQIPKGLRKQEETKLWPGLRKGLFGEMAQWGEVGRNASGNSKESITPLPFGQRPGFWNQPNFATFRDPGVKKKLELEPNPGKSAHLGGGQKSHGSEGARLRRMGSWSKVDGVNNQVSREKEEFKRRKEKLKEVEPPMTPWERNARRELREMEGLGQKRKGLKRIPSWERKGKKEEEETVKPKLMWEGSMSTLPLSENGWAEDKKVSLGWPWGKEGEKDKSKPLFQLGGKTGTITTELFKSFCQAPAADEQKNVAPLVPEWLGNQLSQTPQQFGLEPFSISSTTPVAPPPPQLWTHNNPLPASLKKNLSSVPAPTNSSNTPALQPSIPFTSNSPTTSLFDPDLITGTSLVPLPSQPTTFPAKDIQTTDNPLVPVIGTQPQPFLFPSLWNRLNSNPSKGFNPMILPSEAPATTNLEIQPTTSIPNLTLAPSIRLDSPSLFLPPLNSELKAPAQSMAVQQPPAIINLFNQPTTPPAPTSEPAPSSDPSSDELRPTMANSLPNTVNKPKLINPNPPQKAPYRKLLTAPTNNKKLKAQRPRQVALHDSQPTQTARDLRPIKDAGPGSKKKPSWSLSISPRNTIEMLQDPVKYERRARLDRRGEEKDCNKGWVEGEHFRRRTVGKEEEAASGQVKKVGRVERWKDNEPRKMEEKKMQTKYPRSDVEEKGIGTSGTKKPIEDRGTAHQDDRIAVPEVEMERGYCESIHRAKSNNPQNNGHSGGLFWTGDKETDGLLNDIFTPEKEERMTAVIAPKRNPLMTRNGNRLHLTDFRRK